MDRHLPDALFGESSILSVQYRRISGQEACLSGPARRTPGAEDRSTAVKCRRGGHPGIQTFPPHRKQGSECGLKTAARTTRPVSCMPHDIDLFCRHDLSPHRTFRKRNSIRFSVAGCCSSVAEQEDLRQYWTACMLSMIRRQRYAITMRPLPEKQAPSARMVLKRPFLGDLPVRSFSSH